MLYKQQQKKNHLGHVIRAHRVTTLDKLNLLPSMWSKCREMTSMTAFTISGKRRHPRQGRNSKAVGAATPSTNSNWSWWRRKNLGKREFTRSCLGKKITVKKLILSICLSCWHQSESSTDVWPAQSLVQSLVNSFVSTTSDGGCFQGNRKLHRKGLPAFSVTPAGQIITS